MNWIRCRKQQLERWAYTQLVRLIRLRKGWYADQAKKHTDAIADLEEGTLAFLYHEVVGYGFGQLYWFCVWNAWARRSWNEG